MLVQVDGILHGDHGASPHGLNQMHGEIVDRPCMPATDWRHIDQSPLDQLDARIRGEHPCLAHSVIVGYGQAMTPVGVFGSH
jgi:hypothetical protein